MYDTAAARNQLLQWYKGVGLGIGTSDKLTTPPPEPEAFRAICEP